MMMLSREAPLKPPGHFTSGPCCTRGNSGLQELNVPSSLFRIMHSAGLFIVVNGLLGPEYFMIFSCRNTVYY